MSYIRKVTGNNERLVLLTGLHWIYLAEAILTFVVVFGIGLGLDHILKEYSGYKVIGYDVNLYFLEIKAEYTQLPLMFGLVGFALFFVIFTKYLSTEIGLTDRRIIHKRGVIKIDVQQVELEDIRGEHVQHGWLGWLFGYGRIHFDCRFIDDVILPATRDPYRLIKAAHTARMRSEHIPAYGEKELGQDIDRIDQQRVEAFKKREKLLRVARITKQDFNKAKKKSTT